MRYLFIVLMSTAFFGCLKTREDMNQVEQRQVIQQQNPAATIKVAPVDPATKLTEVEEEMRNLTGRLEVLENNQKQSAQANSAEKKNGEQQTKELSAKLNLLQEELIKMESQISTLQNEINGLRNSLGASSAGKGEKDKNGKTSTMDTADQHFKAKDWKKAILAFQKYRDDNPKGKYFADATYKIGLSFQELKMKDEARTFFDEVISKFPQTDLAKKAKGRLSQLKK